MWGRNKSKLERLCRWYESQCNGDWEHCYGMKLTTLDNPGWHLTVELAETNLEGLSFESVKLERSEHDWLHAFIREGKFEMACGPLNLEEGVQRFLDWADSVGSPT